jgi:ferrochelatase
VSDRIAVLVMAYGGPESLDQVEPYLLDVRGGRPISAEGLAEVISRYARIGGRSPILEHTREQARALESALNLSTGEFKSFVGMRHWYPYIHEALAEIRDEGIRRVVGIVMAPHYSRMSIGAYYARLNDALEHMSDPPQVIGVESWNTNPGYLETLRAHIGEALDRFPEADRDGVHLIFTAHSLPERILEWQDPYPDELRATFQRLSAQFPAHRSHFAYQSAAMTPEEWLGPDAGDLMSELMETGARDFLVVPIGFVSEHVEILYDIDVECRELVETHGGRLERIEMPGADPRMMQALARVILQKSMKEGWL